SPTVVKTMGMARVCCSSAVVVGVVFERMMSGCSATSSFANRCIDCVSVDPRVVAFRPTELVKSVPECCDMSLCFRVALEMAHQHTDPPHPLALLRPRRERPRRRAAEERDEVAPFHSITSSARARNDSGTARPMALAVLRLTTSWNVVGYCTGRSGDLAPRSMRSTYPAAC